LLAAYINAARITPLAMGREIRGQYGVLLHDFKQRGK
jgi:hypothetical protein